jgi:hypothetical protein
LDERGWSFELVKQFGQDLVKSKLEVFLSSFKKVLASLNCFLIILSSFCVTNNLQPLRNIIPLPPQNYILICVSLCYSGRWQWTAMQWQLGWKICPPRKREFKNENLWTENSVKFCNEKLS